MANPITEVRLFRNGVREIVENMRGINAALASIEDSGATLTEQRAFLNSVEGGAMFGETGSPNPDITQAEFEAGIVALRALRDEWNAQKFAIAKLLI